jgi:hypothetical protein
MSQVIKQVKGNRVEVYDNNNNLIASYEMKFEDLKNIIINEITSNYALQFTFTLPTGQKITVVASWVKQG